MSRDPRRIRRNYRRVADQHGLDFFDYPPGHARSVLERALEHQPCPVAADQVKDVRDYLPLLRQRSEPLPAGGGVPVLLAPARSAAFDPTRFDRDVVNARLSNPAAGYTSRLWL